MTVVKVSGPSVLVTLLANGTSEADHISVRVGDGALPLAVVLVSRAGDFDPCLPPILGHSVGVLAVDVENTVTREIFFPSLGKVHREVSIPVSERICVIVDRHFEARTLEPGD